MRSTLIKKLKQLKNKKIAIIGDIILDRYVYGDVNRISPEAPVPVVRVRKVEDNLGAAANVALNIAAMGGIPVLIGLVGDDAHGELIRNLLHLNNIDDSYLIAKKGFTSILKERVIGLNQQVVRIDYDPPENSYRIVNNVLASLEETAPQGVIIEDYNKGLIYKQMIEKTSALCRKRGILTVADPHPTRSCGFYRGVDAITPNSNEAAALLHLKADPEPEKIAKMLAVRCGTSTNLITRGSQGMLLMENGNFHSIPTRARKVYDVTGAGDTVVALFTMACVSGFSPLEAAQLANFGASYVVTRIGTAAPDETIMRDTINGK